MSSFTKILLWVSEVEEGSFSSFQKAWEWLEPDRSVPAALVRYKMSILNHIQCDYATNTWKVLPSALTLLPNTALVGVITGARPYKIQKSINEALGDLEGGGISELEKLAANIYPHLYSEPTGPGTWYLQMGPQGFLHGEALSNYLSLEWQPNAWKIAYKNLPNKLEYSNFLLKNITPHEESVTRQYYNINKGWCELEKADMHEKGIVLKVQNYGPPSYYVKHDGALGDASWLMTHDKLLAMWCSFFLQGYLCRLKYEPKLKVILAPWSAPLPLKHSSALAYCSGSTGRKIRLNNTYYRLYENVPSCVAEKIAVSLNQKLDMPSLQNLYSSIYP